VLYSSPWTKQSSVTHLLELKHLDPDLTVRLYWANHDDGLHARWQSYCRAFSVRPVERLAPGWPVSRPVEDIGRPMMALVLEGKIQIPEPTLAVPAGISIGRTDAGLAAEVEGCRVTVRQDGLSIRPRGAEGERCYPYGRVESMVVKPATYRSPAALDIGVVAMTRDEREGDQESRWEIPFGEGLPVAALEWAQARLLQEIASQPH
jgi:hypothetical protein